MHTRPTPALLAFAAVLLLGMALAPRPATPEEEATEPPVVDPHAAALPDGSAPARPTGWRHVVAAGDSLPEIAAQYGRRIAEVAAANGLDGSVPLRVGQVLVIPDRPRRPVHALAITAADAPHVGRMIARAAARHDVDPTLLQALAWVESRWRHDASSHAGAIGVLQLLPASGEVASRLVGRRLDLRDPADNTEAGAAFLAWLLDRFDGDVRRALAAYFQGPTSVERDGVRPASVRYVQAVLDAYATLAATRGGQG